MYVKHAELNRLLSPTDSLDQDKGVIEFGNDHAIYFTAPHPEHL